MLETCRETRDSKHETDKNCMNLFDENMSILFPLLFCRT